MHWTQAMPPTKASNLYSTFSLNSTRLPVTSDMTCQKLPFTAHGQHGRSEDQIQWSYPSHFFSFWAANIELFTDNPSRLKELPKKQKPSEVWDEGRRLAYLFLHASAKLLLLTILEKIIHKLHLIQNRTICFGEYCIFITWKP